LTEGLFVPGCAVMSSL